MPKLTPEIPQITGNKDSVQIALDPNLHEKKFREITPGVTVGYRGTRPISMLVFGTKALEQLQPTDVGEYQEPNIVLRVRGELRGTNLASDLSGAFNRISQAEGNSPRAVASGFINEFVADQLDVQNALETIAEMNEKGEQGIPFSTLGNQLNLE